MPNGDPNWHVNEFPALERFFAPLAEEIQQFASRHNMEIIRYYHEAPDWRLGFTPPQGGSASIDIRRVTDHSLKLFTIWFVDDFDAATRSMRTGKYPEHQVADVSLRAILKDALAEILSWKTGEWSQVARGYEPIWHEHTREQFEKMAIHWPKLRLPSEAE